MGFPFYPTGAIAATLALAGTLALFRFLLLALDRGAAELRGSIGPGLVRGVRAWAGEREGLPSAPTTSRATPGGRRQYPGSVPPGAVLEDLVASPGLAVEAVRSRSRHR